MTRFRQWLARSYAGAVISVAVLLLLSSGPLGAQASKIVTTTGVMYVRSFVLATTAAFGWSDVVLVRDAANALALKNGTNAQSFNIYNIVSGSDSEFGFARWSSNVFQVGTGITGAGVNRSMRLMTGSNGTIVFTPGNTASWTMTSAGNFIATTDGAVNIGNGSGTLTRPASVFVSSPAITVGSGTGISITNAGELRDLTYKVTIASTAFVCAAVTCDVTIGTFPADTHLATVYAKLNTTFACTATCTSSTLSMIVGKGSGGAEYLASFDADAATAVFGDADAEMGTLLTRAAAIQGGTYHTTTQAVVLRLTSGTGNIGNGAATNLSQGSVVIYLTTRVLP